MGFVILCMICALLGYLLGLWQASRIADHMIAEMRLEAGLDDEDEEEEDEYGYTEYYRDEYDEYDGWR